MAVCNLIRSATALLALVLLAAPVAEGRKAGSNLDGMWSDPPTTALGEFCFAWCTDAGIERLNRLLDDPANDARPFADILAEANNYQRETYIKPKLINEALRKFPISPLDDPAYLRCEPFGFARQILARHQLQIQQRDISRIEMRYGEWDVRRTIYLDGRKRADNEPTARLGHSIGHWEGDTLVIETSGISANIMLGNNGTPHTDQLRVVERYSRSADGKTLLLTAMFEDPLSLREPIVLKKIWSWSPQSRIDAYKDCELPAQATKGGKRP
jgi:hypothetical protein